MFETEKNNDIFHEETNKNEYATTETQNTTLENKNDNNIIEKETSDDLSSSEHDNERLPIQLLKIPDSIFTTAANVSNFLYSAANYAGQAVRDASDKIIETVEENNILRHFNNVQNLFINEKDNMSKEYLPPWEGYADRDVIREECLAISADKRNFLRSPPVGTNFNFDYKTACLTAIAVMKEDARLEKIRYDLVPKAISEELFWRNYFYRVNLILQAYVTNTKQDLLTCSSANPQQSEESWIKEIEDELNDYDESHST